VLFIGTQFSILYTLEAPRDCLTEILNSQRPSIKKEIIGTQFSILYTLEAPRDCLTPILNSQRPSILTTQSLYVETFENLHSKHRTNDFPEKIKCLGIVGSCPVSRDRACAGSTNRRCAARRPPTKTPPCLFFFKINKKIKTPNRSAARRPPAKTPPCLNLKNNKKIKTSSKAPPVCEPRKTNLKL